MVMRGGLFLVIGVSLRTNREYHFAVRGECSIFAPSKGLLNVYDYETDSFFT
jgi:hypothetical protein